MSSADIVSTVNKVFAEEFELDPATLIPEAHLINDLGLDSLDYVDMVICLQNAFGVKLRDEEGLKELRTLDDLYGFVERKKAELST